MSGVKFLLDTNIVIGLLKANSSVISLLEESGCKLAECAVSQITRMELLSFPQLKQDEEENINKFLASITVILFDLSIEKLTIKHRQDKSGKLPDAMIVATALKHGLNLLTLDKTMAKQANS